MSIQDPDATLPTQGYGADATASAPRPVPPGGGGPGGGYGNGGEESDPRRLWFIGGGVLVLGLIIGVVIALAAGGGDDTKESTSTSTSSTSTSTSTSTSSSTTTTTGAGPTVLQFTVNPSPVNCPELGGIVNINLVWATTNTTGVTISIDGPTPFGSYGPTDNLQFPFACPAGQHTYVLTANGQNGQKLQKQLVVTGVAPPTTTTPTT
ncbi:MAG: hypothetical protein EXQ79_00560 [Acidimicrobiia bacterium]|nr:hypothetical protein [Acidimicrobiia bacterium]